MANNTNERFSFPDQVWFDASNPGPLHDALGSDFARVRASIERRPSLRRHFAQCPTCQEIAAAVAGTPAPTAGLKRMKVKIDMQLMHQLLGLPANVEILHMWADGDPNIVWVKVAGEGMPATDPRLPAPSFSPDTGDPAHHV